MIITYNIVLYREHTSTLCTIIYRNSKVFFFPENEWIIKNNNLKPCYKCLQCSIHIFRSNKQILYIQQFIWSTNQSKYNLSNRNKNNKKLICTPNPSHPSFPEFISNINCATQLTSLELTIIYHSVRKEPDFFFAKTWWISMKYACMRWP